MTDKPKKPIILLVDDESSARESFIQVIIRIAQLNSVDVDTLMPHIVQLDNPDVAIEYITKNGQDIAAVVADNHYEGSARGADILKVAGEVNPNIIHAFLSSTPPTTDECAHAGITFKNYVDKMEVFRFKNMEDDELSRFMEGEPSDSPGLKEAKVNGVVLLSKIINALNTKEKSPLEIARRLEPKKLVIVHVEDNKELLDEFKNFIRQSAAVLDLNPDEAESHLKQFRNGREALEFIQKNIQDIKAVYTDHDLLDGKHGLEIMKLTKEAAEEAGLPVPLRSWLSGHILLEDIREEMGLTEDDTKDRVPIGVMGQLPTGLNKKILLREDSELSDKYDKDRVDNFNNRVRPVIESLGLSEVKNAPDTVRGQEKKGPMGQVERDNGERGVV